MCVFSMVVGNIYNGTGKKGTEKKALGKKGTGKKSTLTKYGNRTTTCHTSSRVPTYKKCISEVFIENCSNLTPTLSKHSVRRSQN